MIQLRFVNDWFTYNDNIYIKSDVEIGNDYLCCSLDGEVEYFDEHLKVKELEMVQKPKFKFKEKLL